ncbi:hypothetical protein ABC382_22765 [Lysinibacillus sp. 1P01SD]|uniref:hypothetical protein n=1 Tax=Lysinibacillus sp. 1P01SD TaxID=3132285 RepID=UPI0039A085A8
MNLKKREILFESSKKLKNSFVYSLTFSGVVPLFIWIWKPDIKIPLAICVMIISFLFLIIILLSYAISIVWDNYKREMKNNDVHPSIVNIRSEGDTQIIIVNKSTIFSYNIYVSFFKKESDGTEYFLGNGLVTNIQNNGLIQVTVIYWNNIEANFIQQLIAGNQHEWKKVIVKPYIEQQILSEILGGN